MHRLLKQTADTPTAPIKDVDALAWIDTANRTQTTDSVINWRTAEQAEQSRAEQAERRTKLHEYNPSADLFEASRIDNSTAEAQRKAQEAIEAYKRKHNIK